MGTAVLLANFYTKRHLLNLFKSIKFVISQRKLCYLSSSIGKDTKEKHRRSSSTHIKHTHKGKKSEWKTSREEETSKIKYKNKHIILKCGENGTTSNNTDNNKIERNTNNNDDGIGDDDCVSFSHDDDFLFIMSIRWNNLKDWLVYFKPSNWFLLLINGTIMSLSNGQPRLFENCGISGFWTKV